MSYPEIEGKEIGPLIKRTKKKPQEDLLPGMEESYNNVKEK